MREHRFARGIGGLAVGIALAFAIAPSVVAQEEPAEEAALGQAIEETVQAQTADLGTTIQERVDAMLERAAEFQSAEVAAPVVPAPPAMTVTVGAPEITTAAPEESGGAVTTAAPEETGETMTTAAPEETGGTMTTEAAPAAPAEETSTTPSY